MLLFTTRNIHRTITCESGQLPSRKSFFFLHQQTYIAFTILLSYSMYCTSHFVSYNMYCTYALCTYTLFCTCFAFCTINRTRKQTLLIRRLNFVFIKDLPSVSQWKLQTATAGNEQQPTLTTKFFFFLSINQWSLFFPTKLEAECLYLYQKYAPLLSQEFCADL